MKPRKTVKKMEWNRNRPLGLNDDDEEDDGVCLVCLRPILFSYRWAIFMKFGIGVMAL
jgi:hypothetical protein